MEWHTHRELQKKCRRIKGAYVHRIGGTNANVHRARSIEPFVTISNLVRELKRASSFEANQRMNHKAMNWQPGLWRGTIRPTGSMQASHEYRPTAIPVRQVPPSFHASQRRAKSAPLMKPATIVRLFAPNQIPLGMNENEYARMPAVPTTLKTLANPGAQGSVLGTAKAAPPKESF